jgi:hypothetical protein
MNYLQEFMPTIKTAFTGAIAYVISSIRSFTIFAQALPNVEAATVWIGLLIKIITLISVMAVAGLNIRKLLKK